MTEDQIVATVIALVAGYIFFGLTPRVYKNIIMLFLTMELESERIERRRQGERHPFWGTVIDILTLRPLLERNAANQRRAVESIRRRSAEAADAAMDRFFEEDYLATAELIDRIARELARHEVVGVQGERAEILGVAYGEVVVRQAPVIETVKAWRPPTHSGSDPVIRTGRKSHPKRRRLDKGYA